MALNPSIILSGQPVDILGSMARGNELAAQTNAVRDQNALRQVYQTQGAGLLAGNQSSLNALAAIDPTTAMSLQNSFTQGQETARRIEILNAQEKRAIAEAAAQMDEREKADALKAAQQEVLKFVMAPDEATFNQMVTQAGKPELVGMYANRQRLGALYMDDFQKAFETAVGPAVDPMNPKDRYTQVDGVGLVDLAAEGGPKPVQFGDGTPQTPPADPKAEMDLRKEFNSLPTVRNFAVQSDAYAKVVSAAKDPSAAGDLALIFSFMKMLDPTSVVREQEFANAQNAAGVPERIRALYNNVLTGERLTPSTRADFLSQTDAIYKGAEREYANVEKQYRGISERQGLPTENTIIDFRYSGPTYTPPVSMRDLSAAGIGQNQPPQIPVTPAPAPTPATPTTQPAAAPNRADVAPKGKATIQIDGQTYTIEEIE